MVHKTLREQYAAALLILGFRRTPGKSSKYQTWEKEGADAKIFLGKSGSVRQGKNVSNSFAISSRKKASLLKLAPRGEQL